MVEKEARGQLTGLRYGEREEVEEAEWRKGGRRVKKRRRERTRG